ncbi:myb/SANT-like DNA-binding domain-containing protein 3 [Prorops nasuta]|uniref:myb/SANT-like DNA-binding domain-containing protein 3 n=1 Tax=Prorops nasuta TaxID=863751 RepID=UPI0034CD72B4
MRLGLDQDTFFNRPNNILSKMNRSVFCIKEKEILCDIINKYKSIIINKSTDGVTNKEKEETWLKVTNDFNEYNLSTRTPQQLRKCWENMVQKNRKENTKRKAHRLRTGGGPFEECVNDPIMERVASISTFNDVEILQKWDSTSHFEKTGNIMSQNKDTIYYIVDSDDNNNNISNTILKSTMNHDGSSSESEENIFFGKDNSKVNLEPVPSTSKLYINDKKQCEHVESDHSTTNIRIKKRKLNNLNKEYESFDKEVEKIIKYAESQRDAKKTRNHTNLSQEVVLRTRKIAESIVQQKELHEEKLKIAKMETKIQILKLLQVENSMQQLVQENDI